MRTPWLLLAVAGCAVQPTGTVEQQAAVAPDVKRARAELIRDAAAEMGVHNAALLGGIATSETNFAHCWEEAQYACKGPPSPSCGGRPIIAGSADGPCSAEQGGLGLFQFDAGTYADTVAAYTDAVLTVEGNTAQAVAFVVDKVELDIPGVTDWQTAVAWLDDVPLIAGEPRTEQWAHLMACRYNGCCSDSALCNSRAAGYRDNAIAMVDELGAEFWQTADRCAALPDDGVIDQRTPCYVAGGEPRYWRREAGGFGDDHEWTATTAAAAPSNFAQWLLRPGRATTYRIEAYVEGGTATTASYEIHHAGTVDVVTIDQSAVSGFVPLGDFELVGGGTESVVLGDNTGVADQMLAVDALRVTAADRVGGGGDDGSGGDVVGGCAAGGGGAGGVVGLGIVVGVLARRRRRRR